MSDEFDRSEKVPYLYHGVYWSLSAKALIHKFEILEEPEEGRFTRTGEYAHYEKFAKNAALFRPGQMYRIPTLVQNDKRSCWFSANVVTRIGPFIDKAFAESLVLADKAAKQEKESYDLEKRSADELADMQHVMRPLVRAYNNIKTTRGRIAYELLLIQHLRTMAD